MKKTKIIRRHDELSKQKIQSMEQNVASIEQQYGNYVTETADEKKQLETRLKQIESEEKNFSNQIHQQRTEIDKEYALTINREWLAKTIERLAKQGRFDDSFSHPDYYHWKNKYCLSSDNKLIQKQRLGVDSRTISVEYNPERKISEVYFSTWLGTRYGSQTFTVKVKENGILIKNYTVTGKCTSSFSKAYLKPTIEALKTVCKLLDEQEMFSKSQIEENKRLSEHIINRKQNWDFRSSC